MRLTLRNVGYMCRLGLSTFLCEGAIAMMMFAGNYVFIRYLGEDGVAAFSIACYFFPIIFMVYNAIGQSAQPILSYNFGAGNGARVRKAFRLALLTAVAAGLGSSALRRCSAAGSWPCSSTAPAPPVRLPSGGFRCSLRDSFSLR